MKEFAAGIEEALSHFRTISLEELNDFRLMNRIDTKYVFHTTKLQYLLEEAAGDYRVLSVGDRRIFRYQSLYLDTPELKSYLDHHNGIRPRYKVRFREYEDSGACFLEVKSKTGKERTRKIRTEVEGFEEILSERSVAYIREHYPFGVTDLVPALRTLFRRITLVGTGIPERITIDTGLGFRYGRDERELPFLAVCEVKRDQCCGSTKFMQILKSARIYPAPMSKYCLGTLLLKQGVKYNRFKRSMLSLNKLESISGSGPVAWQNR